MKRLLQFATKHSRTSLALLGLSAKVRRYTVRSSPAPYRPAI